MSRVAITLGMVVTFGLLISIALAVGFGSNTYLFQDGSTPLTGNWPTGTFNITSGDHIFAKNLFANATQPLNSMGLSFSTVQGAIDDLSGDGWVYVPEGVWDEAVTLGANVDLFGAGKSSIIDGGTLGTAVTINGANSSVRHIQLRTTPGQGNTFRGILVNGIRAFIFDVYISASDRDGIYINAVNVLVQSCFIYGVDNTGVYVGAADAVIIGCNFYDNFFHIEFGNAADGSVAIGNRMDDCTNSAIIVYVNAENCAVIGNRITNEGALKINDVSGTSYISSNPEVSDMIPSTLRLQFRDPQIYLASLDDGHLDVEADVSIDLNAPVSIDGDLDINHNYVLEFEQRNWLHIATAPGVVDVNINAIPAGTHSQDEHYSMLMVSLDTAPGGGKFFNVTIGDGTNEMLVSITGASTFGSTTTGAFDLDVSAENFTMTYSQTAGGLTDHACVMMHWHYKINE